MARDTNASKKPFLHLVLLFALLFQVNCFRNVISIKRCIVKPNVKIRSSHMGNALLPGGT